MTTDQALTKILQDLGSVVVAFSGGIDSTVVLKVAHGALGERAVGVTAASATLPAAELDEARRLAQEIGARHVVFDTDQLAMSEFARNDSTRCYHCKTDLYRGLEGLRRRWDLAAIVDGTHRDDLGDDRPGLRAAHEWGVRSPLLEAGLTKAEVRALAHALGLSNADKPAAACLSSRIPRGTPITVERLSRVERAEAVLLQAGFRQVRVRDYGALARIELGNDELSRFEAADREAGLSEAVKALGFAAVTAAPYRRGG